MAYDMKKDDDNLFHILKYSKPITFVSSGFLDDTDRKMELEDNDHEQLQYDAIEDDKDAHDADDYIDEDIVKVDVDTFNVDQVDDDDAIKVDQYDDAYENVDTSIV